ncbi:MAG: PfkB family carbohydrate kinase [Myxococcota bacterium]|nr:PfkB family carbohydrate kinase [Myxococcota bacterium]
MSEGHREQGVVVLGHGQIGLVTDDPLVDASTFRRTMTGDSLISAVVAAREGLPTALVTRVGDDVYGSWLLEQWEEEGIHLDFVRQIPGSNPLELRSNAASGQALMWRDGAAPASMDASDVEGIPWDLMSVLYVPGSTQALGAGPREATRYAMEAARAAGVQTVHAPLLRSGIWPTGAEVAARAAFEEILPVTDVLVIEAPYSAGKLLGRADAQEAARAARDHGVRRVIVRQREKGCLLAEGNSFETVESPKAATSSPIFLGTLVARLAEGKPMREATENALEAEAKNHFLWNFEQ